ncbi:unnamed protein product, partial [Sphacelaria rigidula]
LDQLVSGSISNAIMMGQDLIDCVTCKNEESAVTVVNHLPCTNMPCPVRRGGTVDGTGLHTPGPTRTQTLEYSLHKIHKPHPCFLPDASRRTDGDVAARRAARSKPCGA